MLDLHMLKSTNMQMSWGILYKYVYKYVLVPTVGLSYISMYNIQWKAIWYQTPLFKEQGSYAIFLKACKT